MALTTQEKMALLQDKLSKTQNLFDFTGLTYEDIITRINEKLSSEEDFDNFRESAIAQVFLEIFAGAVDLVNFYLQRRAEECYMDTAQLRSSVILLSKMLGYVISRPIPATVKFKMTLDGPLPDGVTSGDTIDLEIHKSFTYDNNPYILKETFTYELSGDVSASDYSAEIDIPYDLIQGEIKNKQILGSTNQQLGQKFQVYRIDDKTFSNIYGTEDYGADGDSWNGLTFVPGDKNVTLISIGNSRDDVEYFKIDRRSLLNWESLTTFTNTSASSRICLIRTSQDEGIELVFGDDKYASIGAGSEEGNNIYIQYLSTLGSKANKVGVIGEKPICNSTILTDKGVDVTNNVTFEFITNIKNGSDFESIESIKYNSPGIYYSLDRCVTKNDYINYLKSLTSPINIKNAVAWGEQEETEGLYKFFNVALFTCISSLYDLTTNPYSLKSLDEVTLEDDYSTSSTETQSSYFNIVVKADPTQRLNDIETSAVSDNVIKVYNKLNDRSQVTVKNIYISPIIHDYNIVGTVYLKKLSDRESVRKKIKNNIYRFLDENADFYTNIYKSNLIEIIEELKEVQYININLSADQTVGLTSWQTPISNWDSSYVTGISTIVNDNILTYDATGIYTVKSFYTDLMKNIYDEIYSYENGNGLAGNRFTSSNYFLTMMSRIYNIYSISIRSNIIDNSGNIIFNNTTNYESLRNELARIKINDSQLLLVYL